MSASKKPPRARQARSLGVVGCQGGDIHVQLYDDSGTCFAEGVVTIETAMTLAEGIMDAIEDIVDETGGECVGHA